MGGGGHDHTLEPPLYRRPLPNRALPGEDELIWNDRVAPETALDLDAPHISPLEGLVFWLGGFAFFYSVYLFAASTDHPANKPTVRAAPRCCARARACAPSPCGRAAAQGACPWPWRLPRPSPSPSPRQRAVWEGGHGQREAEGRGCFGSGAVLCVCPPLSSPRYLTFSSSHTLHPTLACLQNASRELDEESLAVSLGGYTKGGYAQQ